jgi:hypothetical protein
MVGYQSRRKLVEIDFALDECLEDSATLRGTELAFQAGASAVTCRSASLASERRAARLQLAETLDAKTRSDDPIIFASHFVFALTSPWPSP